MDQNSFTELKPKVVLGVAAHPDDLDFAAAGTMAAFASHGAKVYYLILTDGGKGTEDKSLTPQELRKIREDEQRDALKAIGGQSVIFLNYPDGLLEVSMQLKRDIVKVIREVCPDVVVTMDPTMVYSADIGMINHPDHRAAGQATLDAVFPLARDHLSFPELYKDGLKPHKAKTVLLSNFDKHNYVIDISKTFDKKLASISAHASQFKDKDMVQASLKNMAVSSGKMAGFELGEAFMRIDIR